MDGRVLDPASPLYKTAAMPNLRRLASQGASFLNTYITSPQCVPSRTTMMTGLNPERKSAHGPRVAARPKSRSKGRRW